jgi:hypothetical protein
MAPSRLQLTYTQLTNWEYWPFKVVYFPILLYYFWLSLKARSLFFFSAANPSIETGGLLGESKFDILEKIPNEYKALSIFIPAHTSFADVLKIITDSKLEFPIIAKPNVGQRGNAVAKIKTIKNLEAYIFKNKKDFIIQEYIDYKIELGVFYYRLPNETTGKISSVTLKDFLHVIGNGKDNLGILIQKNARAAFQYKRLESEFDYTAVPTKNETIVLEPIGNHCRGTAFLDYNTTIDKKMQQVFDTISKQIEGFYYGRFDLRCKSIEDLKEGRNIKIVELNGAGAEPAHIYQSGFSIFKAWGVLFHHWTKLYQISMLNHKRGISYMTYSEAKKIYRAMK